MSTNPARRRPSLIPPAAWLFTLCLFASLHPLLEAASVQTPWQTNAYGTLFTNISWNYAMGYHFTPLVNGQITGLGGLFNGTKTVKLFNKATGALLVSTTVSAANTWTYTLIPPVTLTAGTTYTVAVYLAGSGGSRRSSLNPGFPRTFGAIRIDGSTYVYTANAPTARPTNLVTTTMYGQADIRFVASDTSMPDSTPPSAPGQPMEGSPDADLDADGAYPVSWPSATDLESGISAYELQERVGSAGSWTSLATTLTGTTFSVIGRTNGSTYYYQVRAKNGAGIWGAFSAVSDGIAVDTQPPTLGPIGITNITATTAQANWTTNEVATCTLWCGTISPPTTQCATTPLNTAHTATLSGLIPNTTHYVHAQCQDPAGHQSAIGSTSFKTSQASVPNSPSLVTVSGRQLLVQRRNPDGTLTPPASYVIRGVAWSPASRTTNTSPTDPNNANVRRAEFGLWYQTDIPLLKAMNVNTVRLFLDPGLDATGRTVLDELYRNGIMVIMTVDDAINNTTRTQQVVNAYKNHPAILMWLLGNEWNINRYYGVATSVLDAAQRTQSAAAMVKTLDAAHPVATSYGDIDANLTEFVNTTISNVDVWGLNVYRPSDTAFRSLFSAWVSLSTKPMFLGEFGVDAFDVRINAVNEPMQTQTIRSLWEDVARNLSGKDATKASLGGAIFAWNDEWWKVSPPGSQETGGWASGAFPDGIGNEEYFGIVNIDRLTRQVYTTLTGLFNPTYVPPPMTVPFTAYSRGYGKWHTYDWGFVNFTKDGTAFYGAQGASGGGYGINVAVVDASTGAIIDSGRNLSTTTVDGGTAYLNSIPTGRLIMLAVADDARLNIGSTCTQRTEAVVQNLLATLEALGSTQIRNYCFRDSWAMITIKGSAVKNEQLNRTTDVTAQTTLTIP